MYSHIINESLIMSIINGEYNNEEKVKSISHLFMLVMENPEHKQQIINDQAKLISSQQKLIEMMQESNENKKNENESSIGKVDHIDDDLKPLYKVFIGQLPQNIPIVQIKNHLNEIFGHVDSVYQLIPDSNYGFALFSNYDSCKKAISRGNIKFQDKSFYIHNAHDRE